VPENAARPAEFDLDVDFDLRLVRYFTVVADHRNFGRAAAALHVAQPALSRQIQRLESHLGVRLLDRTPQGSQLTEAGRAFLPRARALLNEARRATLTARAAGAPASVTLGFVEDLVITPAVKDMRARHPDALIQTRHLECTRARDALLEHRVDAVLGRMPFPFPTDDLHITVLYDEPRVLVVPASHRLADQASVIVDDFADDELVPCPVTAPTDWSAFWRVEPRTDGQPAAVGPVVAYSFEDKLEHVAAGQAIAILPAGDRRFTLRPDITAIPIKGIDPCQVVVVTRVDETNDLVADFRNSALANLVSAPASHRRRAGSAGRS
jgi:DNA-binding transcriptional LysR family regulator